MFYNFFIIGSLGAGAPFLCLVRTFRAGFTQRSAQRVLSEALSDPGSVPLGPPPSATLSALCLYFSNLGALPPITLLPLYLIKYFLLKEK